MEEAKEREQEQAAAEEQEAADNPAMDALRRLAMEGRAYLLDGSHVRLEAPVRIDLEVGGGTALGDLAGPLAGDGALYLAAALLAEAAALEPLRGVLPQVQPPQK